MPGRSPPQFACEVRFHTSGYAGWGIGMANDLEVDSAGLRVAAADSEAAAASAFSGAPSGGSASSQPSGAGVDAVYAALASAQSRQSQRITGQASNLTTSSARYDTTDQDGADAVNTVSV